MCRTVPRPAGRNIAQVGAIVKGRYAGDPLGIAGLTFP